MDTAIGRGVPKGAERRVRDHGEARSADLEAEIAGAVSWSGIFCQRVPCLVAMEAVGAPRHTALGATTAANLSHEPSGCCLRRSLGRSSLSVTRATRMTRGRGRGAAARQDADAVKSEEQQFLKYPFYGASDRHFTCASERVDRSDAAQLNGLRGLMGLQYGDLSPQGRAGIRGGSAPLSSGSRSPYLPAMVMAIDLSRAMWARDITSYIPDDEIGDIERRLMDCGEPEQSWPGGGSRRSRWTSGFCTDDCRSRRWALIRRRSWSSRELVPHRPGWPVHRFAFTGRRQATGIRVSMDGRGRCMDTYADPWRAAARRSLKYGRSIWPTRSPTASRGHGA